MKINGNVFKFGDHVDTDVIIPARYLNTSDPAELAAHCMEDADRAFVANVRPGDIIAAGRNFGCGSSREHAPLAIRTCGVSCVVAESFARIFFRNAINIGLPVLECPEAARDVKNGDRLEVDLAAGTIKNMSNGREYSAVPFPDFMQKLIDAGGLVGYTRTLIAGK